MTYSKTRATKDNTTEYTSANDSPQETLRERQPSSGTDAERSAATIDGLNVTPSPRLDAPEETLVVPSAAEAKDRFASPEYVNPNARLPRIQALRGENGPSDCGYFITETEMAKAGWQHVDESELIIYEYNSGVRFV